MRAWLVIPWPIVSLIDVVARWFGYQTYVTATGGLGWHPGRIGAQRIHFIQHTFGEDWPRKLKARRR